MTKRIWLENVGTKHFWHSQVIGMSRRALYVTQPPSRIVDVLHLEADEADKRKDRERSNNIDQETLRPPRTSKQPPSLIELKRFGEQLSKRSPCQREHRRATEDDLVKHNEEMRNRVAPVGVTRHVLNHMPHEIETHPKRSFVRPAVGGPKQEDNVADLDPDKILPASMLADAAADLELECSKLYSTHTSMHAPTHAHTCTCTNAHTHARTHAHTHAHIQTAQF